MGSSDSSLRFRACEVSQVPDRTLDTRPPALPRPLRTPYVVCRRTMMASSKRKDWPADCDLHEALTHGSLALGLMPSSDKTPARQSPSARLILLLTFRHLYEISSFQLISSAKLVLAYPNLGLTTLQRRPTMTVTLASVPLPCSAAQLENAILKAAHNGHWHDAEVKVHGDKLVITYEDEVA